MTTSGAGDASPSGRIAPRVAELGDWRGGTLARMRQLILDADPAIIEEWKWAKATSPGVPVWSCEGIVCTGETYKAVVKLTFARGAALDDPAGLFNAGLDGNTRRAIDLRADDEPDAAAFQALVRQAVALNRSVKASRARARKS